MSSSHNTQISCGVAHTLITTSSGNIFAFGSSHYGQIGSGKESNVDHPYELGKGYPNTGQYEQLPILPDERIVHVSAGYHHSAAVSSRGILFTWGRDSDGCLGHGMFFRKKDILFHCIYRIGFFLSWQYPPIFF